jgi:hypothetical protein
LPAFPECEEEGFEMQLLCFNINRTAITNGEKNQENAGELNK